MASMGDDARPQPPEGGSGGPGSWIRRAVLVAVGAGSGIATGLVTGSLEAGVTVGAALLSVAADLMR